MSTTTTKLQSHVASILVLVTVAGVALAALAELVDAVPDYLILVGALAFIVGVVGAGVAAGFVARATDATIRRALWEAVKTGVGWLFIFVP